MRLGMEGLGMRLCVEGLGTRLGVEGLGMRLGVEGLGMSDENFPFYGMCIYMYCRNQLIA